MNRQTSAESADAKNGVPAGETSSGADAPPSPEGKALDDVIGMLERNFEKAKNLKYVEKPLSWALYRTWRAVDGIEKGRNPEK